MNFTHFLIIFWWIFKSIWGHSKVIFSRLNFQIFDFSKSVRNRPENTPKPSQNHPQTIPNPSQNFRFFRFFLVRNFRIFFDGFLMDFWWILSSGEAPTLGFWAVDPVWSPPQAPGVVVVVEKTIFLEVSAQLGTPRGVPWGLGWAPYRIHSPKN